MSMSNLASIVNIVTIDCLLDLYLIVPLKSYIIYTYELLRSKVLSIKDISLTIINISAPPNYSASAFIALRYRST